MSRYTVDQFGKSGDLLVVNLDSNDPRFSELTGASFNFPLPVRTIAFCDTLGLTANKTILAALLYAESSEELEQSGPGHFEPLGAVEFNFETGDIRTYVIRDEPMLKGMIDGKRRSWRVKHAQRQ